MAGIALILAIIALLAAIGARRMVKELQARLASVLDELQATRAEVGALRRSLRLPPLADGAAPEPAPASPPEQAQAAAGPSDPAEAAAAPAGTAAPTPEETAAAEQPAGGVPAGPAGPAVPAPAGSAAPTLEEQLGTRWAVWLGGLALALGGVLLVRYSIEQGLFGPEVRVALGAAFALLLIATGEWFRRSERASPIEGVPSAHIPGILTAAGTISAFGTVYAAHALYNFIGPAAAFVLLGAIGIGTMLAAALHGPALAGLGLAGAFLTPLLVTSDQPSPWPVVLYLTVVAAAAYALARLRRWLWLACAAVAGAMVWGLALLGQVEIGAAGPWAAALMVHIGVQVALAAAFMAIEPHLSVADADADPDWIATLALLAMSVLVVLALPATAAHAHWPAFVIIVLAVLAATAWRSAPAAGAAPLAGVVALAALLSWVGLTTAPDPLLLAPALQGVLRLPDNVTGFLAFAGLAALAVGAVAALRLWRGAVLPTTTAGLYALAAVAVPLLMLVVAYLRVTQFDRSFSFALVAVFLAAVFYLVADRFDRRTPAEARTAAERLVIGAFASGVAAAMSLAFVMGLERGYLTVAFAVTAFTTAVFAVVDRISMLRYVVVAIGLIVLGRLAWDPRIMGADVGTWPIFNWLLLGYGAPAAAFLGAGFVLKRVAEDVAARLCDALGVLFAGLLVFFQIRHALNAGDPLAPASGHVEQGLFALMSIGFAAVLVRLDLARANPVFRAASLARISHNSVQFSRDLRRWRADGGALGAGRA